MVKKKSSESILLLLQRTQLSLFRASKGSVVTFPFENGLVQDLEIKDEVAFTKAIQSFISSQKIESAESVILLDKSVYFSQVVEVKSKKTDAESKLEKEKKDSTKTSKKTEDLVDEKEIKKETLTELEEQKRHFVQSMPFANVYSTIVSTGKEKTIIALNRDLYEPIVKVLNEMNLNVSHIYPILVVVELFKEGFTTESASVLLSNKEKYKENNFLHDTLKKEEELLTTVMPTENEDKKRVLLLVIFFVVLLMVLGGVWWWSQNSQVTDQIERKGPAQPASEATVVQDNLTPVPTAIPLPLDLESLLSSTNSADLADIEVEIRNASSDNQAASDLEDKLTAVGFNNVSISAEVSQQAGQTIVSTTPEVPLQLKEALQSQLESWDLAANFEESDDQIAPIIITVTEK